MSTKGQSKKLSLLESIVNVVIGYVLVMGIQIYIFPLFGVHIDSDSQALIASVYMAQSIIRAYLIRRAFNSLL